MFCDLIRNASLSVVVTLAAFLAVASANVLAEEFVAGSEPSLRPVGAPVLLTFVKDAAWYRTALSGIEAPPYPFSLRFLEDQGAWYTPFNRPGLTGPYDIRNWHGSAFGGLADPSQDGELNAHASVFPYWPESRLY